MRIDHQLRQLLVGEICAIAAGSSQYHAAAMLHLRQPQISALRRGHAAGFSVGRLLRLIARQGYHVEIHLRCIPNRFAKPHPVPTATVVRYNAFGRPVPLDA